MAPIRMADILELSVEERLALVEDIWDSIAENQDFPPLTPDQEAELEARLQSLAANPDAGASWAEVRARIHSSRPSST